MTTKAVIIRIKDKVTREQLDKIQELIKDIPGAKILVDEA